MTKVINYLLNRAVLLKFSKTCPVTVNSIDNNNKNNKQTVSVHTWSIELDITSQTLNRKTSHYYTGYVFKIIENSSPFSIEE